jgi:hypothetical protein
MPLNALYMAVVFYVLTGSSSVMLQGSMASYTKESSELLQKVAAIDLNKRQTLHIRVERFHVWLTEKREAHLAHLVGDTSFLADLGKVNVHFLQQVGCSFQQQRTITLWRGYREWSLSLLPLLLLLPPVRHWQCPWCC